MVEFGAGGRVARRDDDAPAAPAAGAEEVPQMGMGVGGGMATPAPAPAPAPRRKKKAKGWYCPVCRQPYTSLLRLALPPSKESGAATPGVIEPTVQRAGSIRSMRTARSTRSVATLPRGAEEMLSGLGPELSDDDDEDQRRIEERERAQEQQRPQFVIAETTTNAPPRSATHTPQPQPQQPATPPPVMTTAPTSPASPPARATAPGPPVTATDSSPAPAPPTAGVANLRVE
jgi:hypothetical protein